MKYDVFIAFARNDSAFVQALAKALQSCRISVLYGAPVERCSSLSQFIREGFESCPYGIVVMSDALLRCDINDDNMRHLAEVLSMNEQILHCVWLNIGEVDVARRCWGLVDKPVLFSPPESPHSIAWKLRVKLAGDSRLQYDTLTGFHPRVQYLSPKIAIHQRPIGHQSHQRLLPTAADISGSDHAAGGEKTLIPGKQSNNTMPEDGVIEPIKPEVALFSVLANPAVRQQLSRRLDVHLIGLSNWRDVATNLGLKQDDVDQLSKAASPTLCLLDNMVSHGLPPEAFGEACLAADRRDVHLCIQEYVKGI